MMDCFVPSETGQWISEKFSILAEIIQDYDHNLELRWIPSDKRTRDDRKPYVVWDTRINKPVLFAEESEIPEHILAQIFMIDNAKGDSVLKKLEAQEAAIKAFQMKEWLDKLEEAHEQAEYLLRSPLNYLKFKGKKMDDQRRIIGTAKGEKYI